MTIPPDGPRKRRRGEGSIYYLSRIRAWQGAWMTKEGRRTTQNMDWRVVEAKLDAVTRVKQRPRQNDRLFMHTRRARAQDWVGRVLAEGRERGWSDAMVADVVVAQLAPRRVRMGIFGPCVYCGSWVAGTIDHVLALYRGGSDAPENLVSACHSCNSTKSFRSEAEWAAGRRVSKHSGVNSAVSSAAVEAREAASVLGIGGDGRIRTGG